MNLHIEIGNRLLAAVTIIALALVASAFLSH